jgi:hypothetical protein
LDSLEGETRAWCTQRYCVLEETTTSAKARDIDLYGDAECSVYRVPLRVVSSLSALVIMLLLQRDHTFLNSARMLESTRACLQAKCLDYVGDGLHFHHIGMRRSEEVSSVFQLMHNGNSMVFVAVSNAAYYVILNCTS